MAARRAALALLAAVACALAAPGARGQPADAELGARVFRDDCTICHGVAGDGRGTAAHHFATAPRDLTQGRFKFRSTASGQVPTDADLRRSIVRGIPGTGMLPQDQLSPAELDAVVAYVKGLSPRFATNPGPKVVAFPREEPGGAAALARGRKAYEKGECAECHGTEGRGDGPSAKDLSIKPADLARRPFKGGPDVRDVLRTLLTGLDGTPMPSYHQVLEDDELWDLARYVDSLGTAPVVTDDERAARHVVRMHRRPRR